MRVISWNVNWDVRATDEYCWDQRKVNIEKYVKKNKGEDTFWHFQEVMPDYMKDFKEWFEHDHNIFTMEVHPCGRQNVSVFPKSISELIQVDVVPLSERHRRVFLKVENDHYVFINVHFPMAECYRNDFTKQLCELTQNETRKVVVSGDFNSFPDGNGFEQTFNIQNKGNLWEVSSIMIDEETGERVLTTFEPFPYDSIPDSAKNAPKYHLDHIFLKNVTTVKEPVKVFKPITQILSDHFPLKLQFF